MCSKWKIGNQWERSPDLVTNKGSTVSQLGLNPVYASSQLRDLGQAKATRGWK